MHQPQKLSGIPAYDGNIYADIEGVPLAIKNSLGVYAFGNDPSVLFGNIINVPVEKTLCVKSVHGFVNLQQQSAVTGFRGVVAFVEDDISGSGCIRFLEFAEMRPRKWME